MDFETLVIWLSFSMTLYLDARSPLLVLWGGNRVHTSLARQLSSISEYARIAIVPFQSSGVQRHSLTHVHGHADLSPGCLDLLVEILNLFFALLLPSNLISVESILENDLLFNGVGLIDLLVKLVATSHLEVHHLVK